MSLDALPPLNWLRAFEAAARHGSFTAAAKELHVTQSAVSQHVAGLERFLGKSLFDRTPRSLRLTEDATNYLPAVQEAFRILQGGTEAFPGTTRGRSVTLQCNMGFAALRLVPRLAALLSAHPWIDLNLVTPVWDPEQTASLADVEIRFGRPDALAGAARATRLTHETCFPVCAPELAGTVHWRAAPLLDCAGTLGTWQRWLAAHGQGAVPERQVTLCSTFAVSLGAAMAGAGLAMAHGGLVADALDDGRLVRPFEGETDMPECYCLVEPPAHLRTQASRTLTEWLLAEFGQIDGTGIDAVGATA